MPENQKSSWFIKDNELDISRGIDATLLGILMLVVRILRTFWIYLVGRNIFKELVYSENDHRKVNVTFARPLTYLALTWIFYFITFSHWLNFSEWLTNLTTFCQQNLPSILSIFFVKYFNAFALLSDFVAENAVSGDIWRLAISLGPILALAALLTVSMILSCKICRVSIDPRSYLSITCYMLGTVVLVDSVYGVVERFLPFVLHVIITIVSLFIAFPYVLYRWFMLTRCLLMISRKRLCLILVIDIFVFITFTIIFAFVLYALLLKN